MQVSRLRGPSFLHLLVTPMAVILAVRCHDAVLLNPVSERKLALRLEDSHHISVLKRYLQPTHRLQTD